MDEFLAIVSKPDNLPVAGMAVAIVLVLAVWFRQARANDRLIKDGRLDEVARRMRR